jgi:hypothetical protein
MFCYEPQGLRPLTFANKSFSYAQFELLATNLPPRIGNLSDRQFCVGQLNGDPAEVFKVFVIRRFL